MPKRILEGDVVSNKTDKTVTVLVERRFRHPVYRKYIRRTDKYAAHDENNQCNVGDRVQIVECRPISKTKRWAVLDSAQGSAPQKRAKPAKDTAQAKEDKPATKKKAPAKAESQPAAKKD